MPNVLSKDYHSLLSHSFSVHDGVDEPDKGPFKHEKGLISLLMWCQSVHDFISQLIQLWEVFLS